MAHNGQLSRLLAENPAATAMVETQRHAQKLSGILDRVGNRLTAWLDYNKEQIPTQDWTETFRYYQAAVLTLLKEERERAKARNKHLSKLSESQLEEHIRGELMRTLDGLSTDEWALIEQALAVHRKPDDRTVS